jgi:hypothetical protein
MTSIPECDGARRSIAFACDVKGSCAPAPLEANCRPGSARASLRFEQAERRHKLAAMQLRCLNIVAILLVLVAAAFQGFAAGAQARDMPAGHRMAIDMPMGMTLPAAQPVACAGCEKIGLSAANCAADCLTVFAAILAPADPQIAPIADCVRLPASAESIGMQQPPLIGPPRPSAYS